MSSQPALGTLSLERLQAFHEELAALVRCGIPLEASLRAASADHRGQQRRLMTQLATRLENGQPLPEALRELKALPAEYVAVVECGYRSGRLAEVLECVTASLRRSWRVRSTLFASMTYPLAVCALAFLLLIVTLHYFSPPLLAAMESDYRDPKSINIQWIGWVRQTMPWWSWIAPLAACGTWLAWRWLMPRDQKGSSLLTGGLMRHSRTAAFANVLLLLLKSHTPLPEALALAGQASGSRGLARYARELGQPRQGGPAPQPPPGVPALLDWLLQSAHQQPHLVESVETIARQLDRKTNAAEHWLAAVGPAIISLTLGGTAVLIYALIALSPWIVFLYNICAQQFF